jgi:type IV pilus assembly protein PilW
MKTANTRTYATLKHAGFTLVEVMVGMVIGMIGMIVMLQVFSNAESQKRATTGSGDAQSNGAMAIYSLQRDIRQAGYGFNALNAMGCSLALPAPASRTINQLAPVTINPPVADVPAGDANSDTLLIVYGSGEGSPEGDSITSVAGSQVAVFTPANFSAFVNVATTPYRVIAAPSSITVNCALSLSTVTAFASPNLTIASSGAVEEGSLFNLGFAPRILAYAVRAGNLTVCDYMAANCGAACTATDGTCSANWVPIVNNIVSLRAQYGRDILPAPPAARDYVVDTWDQTTPAKPATTLQSAWDSFACSWTRIPAFRLAVVSRNSLVDKGTLTAVAPTWEGSTNNPIDLSGRANWQNYRYKTFETSIPVRNLPWMSACT